MAEKKKGGKSATEGDVSDLITMGEAAKIRDVTPAAISELVRRGRLDSVEMFGRKLVKRSQVEALEDRRGWPKGKPRKGDN